MEHAAACRATAGGHADVVRSRVFGGNIKCLVRENVKRSRCRTKRKERAEWTGRRERNRFHPCAPSNTSRRVCDFAASPRFACVFWRSGGSFDLEELCEEEGRYVHAGLWTLAAMERHVNDSHACGPTRSSRGAADASRPTTAGSEMAPRSGCHFAIRAKEIQRNRRSETRKVGSRQSIRRSSGRC